MVNRLLVALCFSNILVTLSAFNLCSSPPMLAAPNRLRCANCAPIPSVAIALTRSWFYFFFLGPTIMAIILFKLALTRRFGKSLSDRSPRACADPVHVHTGKGFKYYLPEAEEHATTTHAGDERKKRLARRFEHPGQLARFCDPSMPRADALAPPISYVCPAFHPYDCHRTCASHP